ncbi:MULTISPECIES: hypothetical protein [Actinosynnema]|uniref:hypothetical protein n=1 Tax=Actinosynnema TaxID=40566 RepID=UPI0020A3CBFD|nr:hypothetical protein [Actinosynnema pretiosum]
MNTGSTEGRGHVRALCAVLPTPVLLVLGAVGPLDTATSTHAPALAAEPSAWTLPFADVVAVLLATALLTALADVLLRAGAVAREALAHRVRTWLALLARVAPRESGAPAAAPRREFVPAALRQVFLTAFRTHRGPPTAARA